VETVAYVKEMMRRRAQEGRTIFYSSHLIDIVEKVCTRIAVIHAGQIVSVGTVGEVVAASGSSSLEHALLALSARAAPA
jgi:ABC-2 type transport system ATP-binding protein